MPTEGCCEVTLTGFCLADGTPIGLVIQEDTQVGWFNFLTAVFIPGPPPTGTKRCPTDLTNIDIRALDCLTDSVTICSTEPLSVTLLDQPIAVSGTFSTTAEAFVNANVVSIASSILAVTLLAQNGNRRSVIIYNDSEANLFVKFGSGASLISFTVRIPANSSAEFAYPVFTGIITGIWDAANGDARITEVTI